MQTQFTSNGPALVLGTAQLGLPYGISNRTGLPDEGQSATLLRAAAGLGIGYFDTARAYGISEQRIGIAVPPETGVRIVTKLDPLAGLSPDASPRQAADAAQASLDASYHALQRDHLDVLLLHRASHRTAWSGAVWRTLIDAKLRGRIGRLGISAQSPQEVLDALTDPEIKALQFPFNLLDWRWRESGVIAALEKRPDILRHTRSTLLQGLVSGIPAERWPIAEGFDPDKIRQALEGLVRDLKRRDAIDLAIAFVRSHGWIDGVVIGVETGAQLADTAALFSAAPLTAEEGSKVTARLPRVPEMLLDPARWIFPQ